MAMVAYKKPTQSGKKSAGQAKAAAKDAAYYAMMATKASQQRASSTGVSPKKRSQRGKKKQNRDGERGMTVTSAPVTFGSQIRGHKTQFSSSEGGRSMVIHHREFLFPLYGTANNYPTFSASLAGGPAGKILLIDIGNYALFPWLSNFSYLFEKWRVRRLRFFYRPSCSTSTNAVVLLSFDPDAADQATVSPGTGQAAITEMDLMQNALHFTTAPYLPADFSVDLSTSGWRYTRSAGAAALLGSADQALARQSAFGTVYACGFSSSLTTARLGTIEVEFEVELAEPQRNDTTIASANSVQIVAAGVPGQTNAAQYGNNLVLPVSAGSNFVTAQNNAITFLEPGNYIVESSVVGTGALQGAPTSMSCGGSGQSACKNQGSFNGQLINAAATVGSVSSLVTIAAIGDSFIQDISNLWATVGQIITTVTRAVYGFT